MKKMLIAIFLILFFSSLYAEENKSLTTENKIDSIYVLQKKIYKDVKDQPLQNKKYGIEFNFLRLIFFGSEIDYLNHSLSGSFFSLLSNKESRNCIPFFLLPSNC